MPRQDPLLCKALLSTLNRVGLPGIEESSGLERMEAENGSPVTTAAARDTLLFCRDRGWCACRIDDFGSTRWWLTEAGKSRLAGM